MCTCTCRDVFSYSVLQKEGEGEEGHLHHPEIISKFTEQAFYPIGCSRCVTSHGHSVASGFRQVNIL